MNIENTDCFDLSTLEELAKLERSLTICLVLNRPSRSALISPSSMPEVNNILALSRIYAFRTSAPENWDPTLPVFNFCTPNPLPHQLRGGALAAMQLELAKSHRKRKLRGRDEYHYDHKDVTVNEVRQMNHVRPIDKKRHHTTSASVSKQPQATLSNKATNVSMNLSDSSSAEEEDSDSISEM